MAHPEEFTPVIWWEVSEQKVIANSMDNSIGKLSIPNQLEKKLFPSFYRAKQASLGESLSKMLSSQLNHHFSMAVA